MNEGVTQRQRGGFPAQVAWSAVWSMVSRAMRGYGWLLALFAAGAALRLWRLGTLELIGDESYYWLWSRHLDWAYYDHPAGVALVVWLSRTLGGGTEAGIRWLNALLGAACTILTYWVGARLISRRAGLFAAALVAVGAPFLLISRFVYPDALLLALMLANLACFWKLVEERPAPRLGSALIFGASLALLFNAKYTAYLYAGGLLIAVLIDQRWLLRQRRAWLAAGLALLGTLPVLAWNAAHGWASLRWQLYHAGLSLSGSYSLVRNARDVVGYLTWPLALLALAGLGRLRRPAERLLAVTALVLVVPIGMSPANSPRNLVPGVVLLLLLAGRHLSGRLWSKATRWAAAGLAIVGAVAAIYGAGTVANSFGQTPLPASTALPALRRDAAGWRELGRRLAASPGTLFAVDYSMAGQATYYAGREAYTSWEQFSIWGVPDAAEWTIVSEAYVKAESVDQQLHASLEQVVGPQILYYPEWDATKEVHIWQGTRLKLGVPTFLQRLDFLSLLQAR